MADSEAKSGGRNSPSGKNAFRNPAPVRQSSEQEGMAPNVFEKERVTPIGKPGVRVSEDNRIKSRSKE